MRALPAALLLLALPVTSGCFDSGEPAPAPTTSSPAVPDPLATPLDLGFNSTSCKEGIVVALITFDQANRMLPEGFQARDAQALLDLPAATGRAAFFLNALDCGATNEFDPEGLKQGTVSIFVDAPTVEGNRSQALFDFYEFVQYTNSEKLYDQLVAINYTVILTADLTVQITTQPTGGATGNGEVKDEEGAGYTLGITGPGSGTLQDLARFWHNAPGGLAYTDYDVDVSYGQGVGSCTLSAGSIAAEVAGFMTCPSQETLGLAIHTESWKGRIVYLPGVRAV